jgi:hypothetical protein
LPIDNNERLQGVINLVFEKVGQLSVVMWIFNANIVALESYNSVLL